MSSSITAPAEAVTLIDTQLHQHMSDADIAAARDLIQTLNGRHTELDATEKKSLKERLKLSVDCWLAVHEWGGPTSQFIKDECALKGIDGTSKYEWYLAIQLAEGGTPLAELKSDKRAWKDRHNVVVRRAKLAGALDYFRTDGQLKSYDEDKKQWFSKSAEQLVVWIERNGGINGVIALHEQAVAAPRGDNDNDEDVGLDLSPFVQALENDALICASPPALNAAGPVVAVIQRDGDNVRIVPLAGASHKVGDLAAYLPSPGANLSDDLRFWHTTTLLAQLIGRRWSNEVTRPTEDDHEGAKTLPSNPMIFHCGQGKFTISPSRRHTGLVIKITSDVSLGLPDPGSRPMHLASLGVRKMSDAIGGIGAVAAFDHPPEKKGKGQNAVSVVTSGGKTVLKFTNAKDRKASFNVSILPMDKFGSSAITRQWALDVRESYKPGADALVALSAGKLPEKLTDFAAKASGSKHGVTVMIKDGDLSIKLGTSSEQTFGSEGSGTASGVVKADDFSKVIGTINDIAPPSGVLFKLDPKGLLECSFQLGVGEFRILIPLVIEGARSQTLLEQITRD